MGKPLIVTQKREMGWLPCCNCGALVRVILPYIGDVQCEKCMSGGRAYILKEEPMFNDDDDEEDGDYYMKFGLST